MKSVVSPDMLGRNFIRCPLPVSNLSAIGVVAYIPFSEGKGMSTTLYRGDGTSSEGILDLGGLVLTNVPRDLAHQRLLWGRNFGGRGWASHT